MTRIRNLKRMRNKASSEIDKMIAQLSKMYAVNNKSARIWHLQSTLTESGEYECSKSSLCRSTVKTAYSEHINTCTQLYKGFP